MNHETRKTILVITHIYPRFKGCTVAPFVGVWAESLARNFDMIVLAPRHEHAVPERNGVKLKYFGYFFKRYERLSYTTGTFARVRGFKPHYQLLAALYLLCFTAKSILLAKKVKPDLIHSHWFVPGGLVGHITSLVTGVPHVVTVYSDGFLIEKHSLLRRLARIIFRRARAVIAISESIKQHVQVIHPQVEVVYPCNRLF